MFVLNLEVKYKIKYKHKIHIFSISLIHNGNLPMQYTEIYFRRKKNENFIAKLLIVLIFSLKTYIVGTQ